MVETIGKRLRTSRLQRKVSLEDAAHLTKINAARLSDLETDVYTNFPNIAYAKGFLLIYSNFLNVDATPHLSAFEDANTFGLDDYQYLSETPVAQFRVTRRRGGHYSKRRKRRLVATTLVAAMLTLGGFAWYLMLSFQRLGNLEQLAARQQTHPEQSAAAQMETALRAPTLASNSPLTAAPDMAVTHSTSSAIDILAAAVVATGGDGDAMNHFEPAAPSPSSLEADREAAAAMLNGTGVPSRLLPTALSESSGPYANLVIPAKQRADADVVVPETVANRTGGNSETLTAPSRSTLPRTVTANRSARAAGVVPRATAVSVANH